MNWDSVFDAIISISSSSSLRCRIMIANKKYGVNITFVIFLGKVSPKDY